MQNRLTRLAAVLLALAVMLGAFGAHGLKNVLPAVSLAIWEKAVFYHFVHALGLLALSAIEPGRFRSANAPSRIAALLTFGVVVFSGSLYALAYTGQTWLGMITPLGGTAFIAAWLMLAWNVRRGDQ